MTRIRRFSFGGVMCGLAALALTAGCTHGPFYNAAVEGPFFTPANVAAEPSLAGVRRVVLLPAYGGDLVTDETAVTLDRLLVGALQRENRFEVVTLSRAECLRKFRAPEFSSAGALPHGLLGTLRQEYAADAVLFVDVTVYTAYRPLAIGLRGKLAMIDGSRILWNFDNVFSADDPMVANSARRHYLESDRDRVPGADFSVSVLQSPTRFGGYVVATMFSTLPPVLPPVVATKSATGR